MNVGFQKNAKNSLICSRKHKVQLINPRHQCGRLKPCGVCSRDTKNQIFEIAPLINAPDTKVYIKNMKGRYYGKTN